MANEKIYVLKKENVEIKIKGKKNVLKYLNVSQTKLDNFIKADKIIKGYLIKAELTEEAKKALERRKFIEGLINKYPDENATEIYYRTKEKYPQDSKNSINNVIYSVLKKRNKSDVAPNKETLKQKLEREDIEEMERRNKDTRIIEKMPLLGEHGFCWMINRRRCS